MVEVGGTREGFEVGTRRWPPRRGPARLARVLPVTLIPLAVPSAQRHGEEHPEG